MQTLSHARPQPPTRPPLLFLDFEASSLSPDSWPVELGYAWFAEGRVTTRSVLIAPRAAWSMDDWSDEAARMHGITLAEIHAGESADAVAAETDVFAHFDVVSDNPAWEQRWLDRLRGGRARIEVLGLRATMRGRLGETAASAVVHALFRSAPPHRAGPDAERLACAWLAATQSYGLAA